MEMITSRGCNPCERVKKAIKKRKPNTKIKEIDAKSSEGISKLAYHSLMKRNELPVIIVNGKAFNGEKEIMKNLSFILAQSRQSEDSQKEKRLATY